MMINFWKKSVFILLVCIMASCQPENTKSEKPFDRTAIMKQVSQTLILPAYTSMATDAEALSAAVNALKESPDEEKLLVAQQAWKKAKLQWKSAEAFAFGPIDDLFLTNAIDFWPISINGVEQAIESYENQGDYLMAQGSNRKGLSALEHLLFAEGNEVILSKWQEDAKRSAYASLVAAQIAVDANAILKAWESEYQASFDEDASNKAGSSMTLLANEMLYLLENAKQFKLGYPAGLITMSDPVPEQVEAYYAVISKECVANNLAMLEKVFNGNTGLGFDDYLNALNATPDTPLASTINAKFADCSNALEDIEEPLQAAIINSPNKVQVLYQSLIELQNLLKADMMSQLGLVVVFGDTDGD